MAANSVPFFKVGTLAELETVDPQIIAFVLENQTVYHFNETAEEWQSICTAGAGGGGSQLPVGSIFESILPANPATQLGYGVWSIFGAGRVTVGHLEADPDFGVAEGTGGAKTHQLTVGEMPSHTHTQDAHTHVQNAHNHTQDAHTHVQNAHTHGQQYRNTGTAGTVGTQGASTANNASVGTTDSTTAVNQNATATNQAATAVNQNATAVNQNTGGGGAHNNLQPFIVVYRWVRTA